jgi:hypothetical protein
MRARVHFTDGGSGQFYDVDQKEYEEYGDFIFIWTVGRKYLYGFPKERVVSIDFIWEEKEEINI